MTIDTLILKNIYLSKKDKELYNNRDKTDE